MLWGPPSDARREHARVPSELMSDGAINALAVLARARSAGVVTPSLSRLVRRGRGRRRENMGGGRQGWGCLGPAVCLVCLFAEEPCGGYSLIERFRSSVRNE